MTETSTGQGLSREQWLELVDLLAWLKVREQAWIDQGATLIALEPVRTHISKLQKILNNE